MINHEPLYQRMADLKEDIVRKGHIIDALIEAMQKAIRLVRTGGTFETTVAIDALENAIANAKGGIK
jgi:hypothetical protein